MATGDRHDPYAQYNFLVEIDDVGNAVRHQDGPRQPALPAERQLPLGARELIASLASRSSPLDAARPWGR